MSDEGERLLDAILEHDRTVIMADYLKRGRSLAYLSDSELRRAWTARFRIWVRDRQDRSLSALDDAEGELAARNLESPHDTVRFEAEELRREIENNHPGLDDTDIVREYLGGLERPIH